jgi:WD40 repeat protein
MFHPDGERMILPGPDSLLRIWDLAHGKVLVTLPVQARAYAWSRDGTRLTVVRSDLEIEELDGLPWEPGVANAARISFRILAMQTNRIR